MARAPEPAPMFLVPEWIEAHCVVPDGFRRGAPLRLYDFQLTYLGAFYLVKGDTEWDPSNPRRASAFVYRRGIMVGPQKVGKSPHTAAHVCVEGAGPALFAGWAGKDDGYACADHGCRCGWEYAYEPGEPMGMRWPTPLIQLTAVSEEATDNVYDALRPMISEGPLSDLIRHTGEEFTRLPGGGRIDVVTSSAQSRLGQRVTFTPQGEVGIWTRSNKMDRVADTQYRGLAGMGGRASLETNAWDPSEKSVGQQQFESAARDVYRQFTPPPKNLSFSNKEERRRIFRAVYPPDVLRENGGHVDLDTIEAEAVDLAARDENQAKRFFGNILVSGGGKAVDAETWGLLAKPQDVEAGTEIGLGFDGSISDDTTVLRACTRDGYTFLVAKWEPKELASGRVPRTEVHEAVAWAFATFRVGRMLCDPPKWWTEIEGWAGEYGEETVLFFDTNQDRRMGPAVDRWLTMIGEATHTHDDDEFTNSHVLNAHKRKARAKDPDHDERTLYTLTKGPEGEKIDAAVADVLALEAAMSMPALERETGSFVIIS